MKNSQKYRRGYFLPPVSELKWARKEYVTEAPIWCSVDLRDGNQALVVPMSLEEKLEFFSFLVRLGFREIEVGFPAASDTEYAFLRTLIERDLIPDDVTVQVLTQSREHIIARTFAALRGVKKAVVHLYNSTSLAQREQVFQKPQAEITEIAVSGARLLAEHARQTPGDFRFEYSPESFTGTEMEYALEICNAVLDVWRPGPDNPVVINLPVTVSMSLPHIYASQLEFMSDRLKYRPHVILSQHPHNDRGCAVADTELGLLAGAQRVEGTLFGNGERTGNVDIVTLALNLYAHGVDPGLNLENLPEVVAMYEKLTGMRVYERQPYGGKLVFAAFSGSHQDAIAKGMKWHAEHPQEHWSVPYLPIDPQDIGREYEGDVIRINSQSGKGGVAYVLERQFGLELPARLREELGYRVKGVSDRERRELLAPDIYDIFRVEYINLEDPIRLADYHFHRNDHMRVELELDRRGEKLVGAAGGNGRFDAVSNALQALLDCRYTDLTYKEHALGEGSAAQAIAYVSIRAENGRTYWGAGVHTDIMAASINALISAVNRRLKDGSAAL
ncbi:MAG: 2-isopropylmalate synthase [Gracilibacteraceae bacterium]|jgi:2-isopropylmalate synthase|nr:2-isopropylmalate synthase [Gracilibacteraceae bacterium]